MVLKKTLLISFLVLLIIPFVLAQNSDFTPNKPPAEKRALEVRQGQDLDIEGLLEKFSRNNQIISRGPEFMGEYGPPTDLYGVKIHNDEIQYSYSWRLKGTEAHSMDNDEWINQLETNIDYLQNDESWTNTFTLDVAGRLQPLVKDCREDAFKLTTRINEVKNMFLFKKEGEDFRAIARCSDGTVPKVIKSLKPHIYDDRQENINNVFSDLDKQIARGEWPACTCTQDAVYCGYNLVYQCPKEKKLGFVETPSQQYAIIPMQDNYAYLPLIITIASALFIALMVLIVILKKK